ncbi:glycosyltransferase family 8 protein [Ruegeria hyattellae]|uniref:glycosyltransferase family 8 protein n=1 Tax=Ruegeria hyattellae TaxID=3233337 RepID=UPI00355B6196
MFCCDQNYLVFAAHAISQIAALHPDRDFDICLCYGERPVTIPESLAHLDIRLCHVQTGDLFQGLRLDPGKSHDVYLRLALPEAFAEEYDRILYLDSDIFIQGGDFGALLKLDFAPYPIAAVRDNMQWRTPNRRPRQFKILDLPTARYFNAGVILMDVARYNAQDLLNRCVALGKAKADVMIRHDQNLYNATLQGEWAELNPAWNWQFTWSSRLFAMQQEPNLVHFIGGTKPWKDPKGELSPRFANSFRRFAARYFPDTDIIRSEAATLAPNSWKMRKMLIRHLASSKKTAKFLDRFQGELDVLR